MQANGRGSLFAHKLTNSNRWPTVGFSSHCAREGFRTTLVFQLFSFSVSVVFHRIPGQDPDPDPDLGMLLVPTPKMLIPCLDPDSDPLIEGLPLVIVR